MGASDHLQGKQFFHGSTTKLEPGQMIVPGAMLGKHNYSGMAEEIDSPTRGKMDVLRNQFTFVAETEPGAWHWSSGGIGIDPSKRSHVYEVEPLHYIGLDKHISGAHMVTAARVKRRIDIPHPDSVGLSHVQGKLFPSGPRNTWFKTLSEERREANNAKGKQMVAEIQKAKAHRNEQSRWGSEYHQPRFF